MAEAAVEVNSACLHLLKDLLFAYECRSSFSRRSGGSAVWRANNANSKVGPDGVGEAEAIAHHSAILWRLHANVEFVFGCSRRSSYLSGT